MPIINDQSFHSLSLFAGLDDRCLAKIASLFTLLNIPAGTELLHEGELADHLYILLEGRVSLSVSIPGKAQHETVVSTLSKGQLVGWSALLPNSTWQASVRSLKPCRLISIPATTVRDLCEQDREIGYYLMKNALAIVGQRLVDSRLQALDIFGGSNA